MAVLDRKHQYQVFWVRPSSGHNHHEQNANTVVRKMNSATLLSVEPHIFGLPWCQNTTTQKDTSIKKRK